MNFDEKIFLAGGHGMVGSAIKKTLINKGFGNINLGGTIFSPTRDQLNLLNYKDLEEWFQFNRPTVVIIAAARVGGIFANSEKPYDFIFENLKIQTNIIELSRKFAVKKILFLGSSCIYPKLSKQPNIYWIALSKKLTNGMLLRKLQELNYVNLFIINMELMRYH